MTADHGVKFDGEAYLKSLLEIPTAFVEDPQLAQRHLGLHLSAFDPQDKAGALDWFNGNRDVLNSAYGQEAVDSTIADLEYVEGEHNFPLRPEPPHPQLPRISPME